MLGQVPAFALIDQEAQPISQERLAGSVWIADFIFTRCAGQCPLMSARMTALARVFADAPAIRLVSFSVDPAYDTPEVLARYASHHAGASDRWQFVTGDPEAIRRVAREGFHLGVSEEGIVEEPITHSVRLVLIDRQARIRGYYDATDREAMRRLEPDARRLLRETGR
jgi:protein SCO1/2